MPEDHTDYAFFKNNTNISGIVDIMGATCKRQEPDDDGDVSVGVEVGVRNVTDSYIEKVSLKMVVRDEEDSNPGSQDLLARLSCVGAVEYGNHFLGSIAKNATGGLGRMWVRVSLGQDN